jgi:hypothetical protein
VEDGDKPRRYLAALLLLLATTAGVLAWVTVGTSPTARSRRFCYGPLVSTRVKDDDCVAGSAFDGPTSVLRVRATASIAYQTHEFTVRQGLVRIEFSCAGTAILEISEVRGFALVCPGSLGPDMGTIRLRPGVYNLGSAIPGHRAAGQKAKLVVTK